MAPLTWRNVDEPDLTKASRIMERATRNWDGGFNGVGLALDQGRQQQKERRSADAFDTLAAVDSESGVNDALKAISGIVNPRDMTAELRNSVLNLRGVAQGYDSKRASIANTQARTASTNASAARAADDAARRRAREDQQAAMVDSFLRQLPGLNAGTGEGSTVTGEGEPQEAAYQGLDLGAIIPEGQNLQDWNTVNTLLTQMTDYADSFETERASDAKSAEAAEAKAFTDWQQGEGSAVYRDFAQLGIHYDNPKQAFAQAVVQDQQLTDQQKNWLLTNYDAGMSNYAALQGQTASNFDVSGNAGVFLNAGEGFADSASPERVAENVSIINDELRLGSDLSPDKQAILEDAKNAEDFGSVSSALAGLFDTYKDSDGNSIVTASSLEVVQDYISKSDLPRDLIIDAIPNAISNAGLLGGKIKVTKELLDRELKQYLNDKGRRDDEKIRTFRDTERNRAALSKRVQDYTAEISALELQIQQVVGTDNGKGLRPNTDKLQDLYKRRAELGDKLQAEVSKIRDLNNDRNGVQPEETGDGVEALLESVRSLAGNAQLPQSSRPVFDPQTPTPLGGAVDPNASVVNQALQRSAVRSEIDAGLRTINDKLRDGPSSFSNQIAYGFKDLFLPQDQRAAARREAMSGAQAVSWFNSMEAKQLFYKRPDLLAAAAADPVRFYNEFIAERE